MSIAEFDFINVAQTSVNKNILSNRNNMQDKVRHKCQFINSLQAEIDSYLNNLCCLVALQKLSEAIGRVVLLQTIPDSRGLGSLCGSKTRLKHDRHLFITCA